MKRKYTRKAPQSEIRGSKGGSGINLSSDILASIEKVLEHRKVLGLPDDREERLDRALRYQEFIRGKK